MHTSLFVVLLSLCSLVISTPLAVDTHKSQATLNSGAAHSRGPVGVEDRSLDEIYRAALKENGTLRVAWGGDVQASKNGIYKAFTTRFPGIKLDVHCDVSKYLDGYIDHSYQVQKGHDDGADVAVIQAVHNFPRWKSQGRLLPYKVRQWNDIYPDYVDPDGAYTGLHIFTLGFQVYNPAVISNTSLPRTHLDFLRPEWKDRLILTYPNDDDAVLYLFKLITEKYGFDYLHALKAQNVRWVRGTATPSILISNQHNNTAAAVDDRARALNTRSVSFASSNAFTRGISTHQTDDVTMNWPQTGAIFASTRMPDSARLFMSFLMDDQWQGIVSEGRYATRRKFDGARITDQKGGSAPTSYVQFMEDRAKVEAWRFLVEKELGTPVGNDPVKDW